MMKLPATPAQQRAEVREAIDLYVEVFNRSPTPDQLADFMPEYTPKEVAVLWHEATLIEGEPHESQDGQGS